MCLRFVFLLTTRVVAWLRLSRREEAWRITEILILRHQLALLQRQQPCRPELNWADRALLAILLGVIPKARRHGLRLLVTPDTILRWHRGIVRRRWGAKSIRGKSGRPATRRNIKTPMFAAISLQVGSGHAYWLTPHGGWYGSSGTYFSHCTDVSTLAVVAQMCWIAAAASRFQIRIV
jgi:hypothetical protein